MRRRVLEELNSGVERSCPIAVNCKNELNPSRGGLRMGTQGAILLPAMKRGANYSRCKWRNTWYCDKQSGTCQRGASGVEKNKPIWLFRFGDVKGFLGNGILNPWKESKYRPWLLMRNEPAYTGFFAEVWWKRLEPVFDSGIHFVQMSRLLLTLSFSQ